MAKPSKLAMNLLSDLQEAATMGDAGRAIDAAIAERDERLAEFLRSSMPNSYRLMIAEFREQEEKG